MESVESMKDHSKADDLFAQLAFDENVFTFVESCESTLTLVEIRKKCWHRADPILGEDECPLLLGTILLSSLPHCFVDNLDIHYSGRLRFAM